MDHEPLSQGVVHDGSHPIAGRGAWTNVSHNPGRIGHGREKLDEISEFLAREFPQQHTIVRFDGRVSILVGDDSGMMAIRDRYTDVIEEVRDIY